MLTRWTEDRCPQYLFFTQDDLALANLHGARCVRSPPPRDEADQQVISDGLVEGMFSVLSSDHAPFHDEDDSGKRLRWQGAVWDGERFLGRAGGDQFLRCERPEAARPRPRPQNWRRWMELED